VERARGRDRGPAADDRSLTLDRRGPARSDLAVVDLEDDEPMDVESFPVMVRLSEVQSQIAALNRRLDRVGDVLERLDQAIRDGLVARATTRGAEEPFPQGVTARANPMTHPVTPLSARAAPDTGRDEALASVRALFTMRRRPWWQRLPDLLRG
jgi:hypothetical protein